MKIDDNTPAVNPTDNEFSGPNSRARKSASTTTAPGAKEDTVVLPNNPTPEGGRELKVAQLRRSYLNGTYQVEINELSARIVDEHLAIIDGEKELH